MVSYHCEDPNGGWGSVSGMFALLFCRLEVQEKCVFDGWEVNSDRTDWKVRIKDGMHSNTEVMQKPSPKNAPCLVWQNPTFLIISSFCLEKKRILSVTFWKLGMKRIVDWQGHVNFISNFAASNFIWQKPATEKSLILIDSGFDWCDLKPFKQIISYLLLSPCFAKTLGSVLKKENKKKNPFYPENQTRLWLFWKEMLNGANSGDV